VINLAVSYRCRGQEIDYFPEGFDDLSQCEPLYKSFPGWDEDLSRVRAYEELPNAAKDFLKALEDSVGVRIDLVSVGPDRSQTIICKDSQIEIWSNTRQE